MEPICFIYAATEINQSQCRRFPRFFSWFAQDASWLRAQSDCAAHQFSPSLPSGPWDIIDDHSRLCCHAQWYLAEGTEELCHGLSQALQKRALPRALMSDNGSAMLAAETTEGLARLGIVHEKTLPYAPFQKE